MTRRISLEGPFTDAQIAELIGLVRRFDQETNGDTYHVIVVALDASADQMEQMARASFPEQPGRRTDINTIRFGDFGGAEVNEK